MGAVARRFLSLGGQRVWHESLCAWDESLDSSPFDYEGIIPARSANQSRAPGRPISQNFLRGLISY